MAAVFHCDTVEFLCVCVCILTLEQMHGFAADSYVALTSAMHVCLFTCH